SALPEFLCEISYRPPRAALCPADSRGFSQTARNWSRSHPILSKLLPAAIRSSTSRPIPAFSPLEPSSSSHATLRALPGQPPRLLFLFQSGQLRKNALPTAVSLHEEISRSFFRRQRLSREFPFRFRYGSDYRTVAIHADLRIARFH